MKVLVTGSRSWDDEQTIREALDAVASSAEAAGYPRIVVVHGACPKGADAIADAWVRAHPTATAERHPAMWNRHGKIAGRARNREMVKAGADLVLAFIRDDSPGATHCAEVAVEAGLILRVWRYGEPGVYASHATDELPPEVG